MLNTLFIYLFFIVVFDDKQMWGEWRLSFFGDQIIWLRAIVLEGMELSATRDPPL
jgi:hypothetical protein